MKILSTILLLCTAYLSYAQTFIPNEDSPISFEEYNNGTHWIYKNIGDITVGISLQKGNDGYFKTYCAYFIILNNTQNTFTFNPSDVSAQLTKNDKDETLNVFTNEEYMKKIKRSQNWTLGIQAFSAGLSSYSTSVSHTQTPYGTYTTRTHHYNPAVAQNASMQTAIMADKMKNDKDKIESNYLKKHTLYPNDSLEGYMNIEKKEGEIFTLTIYVNGNKYVFDYDISNKKHKKKKEKKEKTQKTVYYSIMY